jgi:hypothetical protein
MSTLYETLAHHQAKTPFENSQEMSFYTDNIGLISQIEEYEPFLKATNSFEIVRANILIRSFINKTLLEKTYAQTMKSLRKDETGPSLKEAMEKTLVKLPCLEKNGRKIYLPFFPAALNDIYGRDFEKLGTRAYLGLVNDFEAALVDPFDYYGYEIFDSAFTRLVMIAQTPKVIACYDFDAKSLYFINNEGRLDARLCLFDKDLTHPSSTHMIARLRKVTNAYFADDREGTLQAMVNEKLISSSLANYLIKKKQKPLRGPREKKEES